ncbi:LPD7 domain-containing protein [Asticcacaulis sp.]|uniref:LPD7 domain-containing protein n=1 Tax=Asticcacaulis sp. TaxID=1872648 RepID=UPI003F7BEE6F
MAKPAPKPDYDLDEAGGAIAARFDALPWNEFEHHDKKRQNALKTEILDIQRDLLKLGQRDMRMAAGIWDEHVPTFVPRPLVFSDPEPYPLVVNTVEPGRRKRRPSTEPWLEATKNAAEPTSTTPSNPAEATPISPEPDTNPNAVRHRLLLEGLEKQYLKAEEKYHFRDRSGEVAFETLGKRLVTSHETPGIVSSMVDLAETRGWETLKVSGTEAFRREAWLQAGLRGLDVTGYRPTKLDKVRLDEMRSEFGPDRGRRNTIANDHEPAPEKTYPGFPHVEDAGRPEHRPELARGQEAVLAALAKAMRARGDSEPAITAAREAAAQKLGKGRIHVGKLAETGTAPYQDKAGEVQSHYVVLVDEAGRRQKIWGADLPRALEAGRVGKGDQIALAFRGQKPVTVTVKVPSQDGKGIRLEKREVERNAWEAVKLDRLRDSVRERIARQATPPAKGARPSDHTRSTERREPLKERYR